LLACRCGGVYVPQTDACLWLWLALFSAVVSPSAAVELLMDLQSFASAACYLRISSLTACVLDGDLHDVC
jgi:hypothetical protein